MSLTLGEQLLLMVLTAVVIDVLAYGVIKLVEAAF
jgi:hypothetical protein